MTLNRHKNEQNDPKNDSKLNEIQHSHAQQYNIKQIGNYQNDVNQNGILKMKYHFEMISIYQQKEILKTYIRQNVIKQNYTQQNDTD